MKCKEWGHLEAAAAASASLDDDKLRRLNAFYFYPMVAGEARRRRPWDTEYSGTQQKHQSEAFTKFQSFIEGIELTIYGTVPDCRLLVLALVSDLWLLRSLVWCGFVMKRGFATTRACELLLLLRNHFPFHCIHIIVVT